MAMETHVSEKRRQRQEWRDLRVQVPVYIGAVTLAYYTITLGGPFSGLYELVGRFVVAFAVYLGIISCFTLTRPKWPRL
jgi:hypothetical protein